MNYKTYDTSIKEKYSVELVGWPSGLSFTSPSEITEVDGARRLRDALKSGSCRWRQMSRAKVKDWSENLAKRREAGEMVGTTRKRRSDAGKKRKSRVDEGSDKENDEEEEEAPRQKRKKTAAAAKAKKGVKDKAKGGTAGKNGKGKARSEMRASNQVPRRTTFAPRSKQAFDSEEDESSGSGSGSGDDDD